VVEASRRQSSRMQRETHPNGTSVRLVPKESVSEPAETELEKAGARRLLAAVDELSERGEGEEHG
jgi:hypothetical protein